MKVLLTTHQFMPDFSAGTEILTLQTAQELVRAGNEVHILTGYPEQEPLDDDERFDEYLYEGLPVRRFHHSWTAMGGQEDLIVMEYNHRFFAENFRAYLQALKPDIVHFFHLQRLSAAAIDVCHELDIPMVFTPTDFWLICPLNQLRLPDNSLCTGPDRFSANCLRHMENFFGLPAQKSRLGNLPDLLVKSLIQVNNLLSWRGRVPFPFVRSVTARLDFMKVRMKRLGRVVAPTRFMQDILIRYGMQPEQVVLSPFGIDLKHIAFRQRIHREPLRVGFIGTLGEYKGCHLLLKAVRNLLADLPLEVKIYGKLTDYPDYVAELKAIAGDDPRIAFYGTFPNDQLDRVFSGLDLLVVPSIWYENTPLVIYSAQAAGCPVIASNLAGMAEVITHEENGLLFEAGDVSGLAQVISRLAVDGEFLATLSARSRRPKPIEEYVSELVDIYRQLIGFKSAV